MKRPIRLGSLSVLLMLAGCDLAPPYQRPPVEIPAQWKEAIPADQKPRGVWWEHFQETTLSELVLRALDENLSLQQQVARLEQARASLQIARADFWPSLALDPSVNTGRKLSFTTNAPVSSNQTTWTAAVDLSYELDLWGRVKNAVRSAEFQAQATAADLEFLRLQIAAQVATSYLTLAAVDEDQRLVAQALELRQQTLKLIGLRVDQKIASLLELEQARREVANLEAQLVGLDHSRALLEHALAVLTGQAAPSFALAPRRLPALVPEPPVGLPSELLERRADVASAERQMAGVYTRIGVAKAAFFPQVRLLGSGGFQSIDFTNLFDWESRVWSLGPSVSLPIFEGGRNRAALAGVEAQLHQARAAYRERLLIAFQEVEDALDGQAVLKRQAEAQDRFVASAQTTAELARTRYHNGLTSLLDLIDAERTLLDARRGANQIRSQRFQAAVLLIRALGGDWSGESLGTAKK